MLLIPLTEIYKNSNEIQGYTQAPQASFAVLLERNENLAYIFKVWRGDCTLSG